MEVFHGHHMKTQLACMSKPVYLNKIRNNTNYNLSQYILLDIKIDFIADLLIRLSPSLLLFVSGLFLYKSLNRSLTSKKLG